MMINCRSIPKVAYTFVERWSDSAIVFALVIFCYSLYAVCVVVPTGSIILDEGVTADIASHLVAGKTIYRDISAPYGPLSFYLYALLFKFFGKSFFMLRMTGLAVMLVSGIIIWNLAKRISVSKAAPLVALVVFLISIGLFQGCRLSASLIGGCFSLIALLFHCRFIESGKRHELLVASSILGLSILNKHNIAAFDILAHGTLLLATKASHERKWPLYLWAIVACLSPSALFLLVNGSFHEIVHDTISMIGHYGRQMAIAPPSFTDVYSFEHAGMFARAFYLDWLIAVLALFRALRSSGTGKIQREQLLLCCSVGAIQLLQDFPLSDLSHHLRAAMVLSLSYSCVADWLFLKRRFVLTTATLIAAYVHIAPVWDLQEKNLFRVNRWPKSTLPYNYGNIREVDEKFIRETLSVIGKYPHERLLVLGHGEYLYFLSDREHPIRQAFVSPYFVIPAEEEQLLQQALAAKASLIVTAPSQRPGTNAMDGLPLFSKFLSEHFQKIEDNGRYAVYLKQAL